VTRTDGDRRISSVAATVIAVGLGIAVAWFGLLLLRFGLYALDEGEWAIGVLAVLLGGALLIGPLVVLLGQVVAWLRRR
jgi:hypothetical protein